MWVTLQSPISAKVYTYTLPHTSNGIWTLVFFRVILNLKYNPIMKKLFLFLLLSLGLMTISYGSYLDNWTDNELCGWVGNPLPPAHIIAEVKKRGISCDGSVAIKTVKTPITKESILESRLQRWQSILKRWNKRIKVNPFSSEKSIKFISSF